LTLSGRSRRRAGPHVEAGPARRDRRRADGRRPLIAWAATRPLPIDHGLADAVVVFATALAIASAPAYARLLGLDPELALVGSLLSTLLVPILAPPLALLLLDLDLGISMTGYALRLALVVGLPTLLSIAIRRSAGAERLASARSQVDGLVVWLLVAFGFGVMDGIGPHFLAEPALTTEATVAAFLVVIALNLASFVLLLPFGTGIAATAGMMSGFRSMALYLAILPDEADPRLRLFFGLYQIPLYLAPLLLRPLYRAARHERPPSA
jgi:BASS family bile acid:Na+ symporter